MSPDLRGMWLVLTLAAGGAACGEVGPRVEITAQRTASRPSSPVLPGATPRERFEAPRGRALAQGSDDLLDYDLPSGWKTLAPTADRFVNLLPAGDAAASCYLSFLQGDAGGLEANVNRWRTQLGGAALSGAEIAALPTVELLGRRGTLVEAEGTFTAMGSTPRAGFKLLGLVVSEPAGSLFLKFTGPAALVEAERERFLALAASLRLAQHGPGDGHDHGASGGETGGPASGAHGGGSGALAWKVPAGWVVQPPRPMREVSFALAEGAECYVSRLIGDAGGLRANLDRWSDQVGRGRLDEATFAGLPKVEILGQVTPLLELEGTFRGMDGVERPGQGLLGVAVVRAHDSLFVKLTGPEEVVRAERANFLAFVGSLEER